MLMLLLALVGGCTNSSTSGPPGPPPVDGTFPTVDLGAGPERPLQLWLDPLRSQARFTLADSSLPADIKAPKKLEIDLAKHRKGRMATVPLPFALDGDARSRIGLEMTVTVGGRELRYASLGGGPFTWRIKGDDLVIQAPPSEKTATIQYAGTASLVKRRILSESGLSPSDFVVHDLTLDGHTRHGLVLPSPSTLAWDVILPAKSPRFRAFPSLDTPPFTDQHSDGMSVVLEVVDSGTVTEVSRKKLDRQAFSEWSAALDAWAGKAVTLQLRTEVEGSPDFDYAFLGSPTVSGDGGEAVRRVLVIGLDTTRPDHFGWYGYSRDTTPELDALANQSAVFTSAYTPAPRTRPSFRSATTGRNPLDAVGAKNIGAVFQEHGFATGGVVANIHLQPRFDFDEGFDTWQFFGKAEANEQVDRALSFFRANADRDAYMFLHFMDPHLRYGAPGPNRDVFVTDPDPDLPFAFDRQQVIGWERSGQLDDRRKAHITALYDGELRFTSREIGRLVDALDAMPGKTLVVVHSDHGEELWDHGGFEHNHTLYREVTNAVLWVRPPGGTAGGPVRSAQPATLADIAPTLYDFAGFEAVPPTDGISLRPFAEGAEPKPRDIGIAHLRYGLDRWAVVHDGKKYIVATGSGEEELYDLGADPTEHRDLSKSVDPTPWRQALAPAHPGLRAGMGWRITLSTRPGSSPLVLTLPSPASDADVLDPETLLAGGRANQAWGEVPRKTPPEVGTVALSPDGRTLTFTPGAKPDGVIWVLFEAPDAPSAKGTTLSTGEKPLDLSANGDGARYVGATGTRVEITPGFVVVPPPDEAARMAALSGDEPSSSDDSTTCQLCRLGYITGDACDVCEGSGEEPDEDPSLH
ncbi:MAG: sulfatase [Myxococcota bacterium]